MKIIKVLVFVMTALLFLGLIALGYGLITKGSKSKKDVVNGKIYLQEPVGTEIEKSFSSDGLLFLQLNGGGIEDRVITIDALTGEKLNSIIVGKEPKID